VKELPLHPTIAKARISFSFFACDFTQLGQQHPEPGRRRGWWQLGRSVAWRARFREASPDEGEFRLPWPSRGREAAQAQSFWATYATGQPTNSLSPTVAWDHFVPFRVAVPLRIDPPASWPGRVGVQGRAFPHGVALLVDAAFDSPQGLSLPAFVEAAERLRRDVLPGSWNGDATSRTLDDFARRALDSLLRSHVGRARVLLEGQRHPFSVATVLRADAAGVPTSDLESQLYTLAAWRAGTPAPDDHLLLEIQVPGDVFLAAGRGRVVWAPSRFAPANPPRHDLVDLHREVTWLSLQVDALHRLVRQVDAYDGDLPPVLLSRRRDAAMLLGRLYGQADRTYGSPSVPRQLDDCDVVPVNHVLQQLGRPPLSR
jgi:hypothetical protein